MSLETEARENIVAAARALNSSGAQFSTFQESYCNERLWQRTQDGGFQLRDEVAPAAGIRDIYVNGSLYAFECATAMVIVLYKAVLDTVGESIFNLYFANMVLYDWHYDSDLRLVTYKDLAGTKPGDILYFRNPDYSPKTPEWQGENAIVMGDQTYYGHGIGIVAAEAIISALNNHRKPGATKSAYLMEQYTRLDFAALSAMVPDSSRVEQLRLSEKSITAAIGLSNYVTF
ncbi:MAG TPA: protein-glutamine gamma-glutamyltransferase [Bacilli bacterium]